MNTFKCFDSLRLPLTYLMFTALLVAGCSDDSSDNGGNPSNPDATSGDTVSDGNETDAVDTAQTCAKPDELPVSSCELRASSEDPKYTVLQGTVLGADEVYNYGKVVVDRTQQPARIKCVGCNCGDELPNESTTRVVCSDTVISPALVNPHEHLGWGAAQPIPHGDERYDHRHDWRRGKRGHNSLSSPGSDYSAAGVLYGELRHLLGGAATIAGSTRGNSARGLMRNLDNPEATSGIDVEVNYSTFPLDDIDGTLLESSCNYGTPDSTSVFSSDIYLPHIAEGIDQEANNEYDCLSSSDSGVGDFIRDETSIIHGIGLTAADIAEVGAHAAQLVWSPRTNISLYGQTADVITYDRFGVPIALGTDWPISGSKNMLRSLRCADYLNQNHFNSYFSTRQLWKMATSNGAKALGVSNQLGSLETGKIADISLFRARFKEPFRAVIEANPADVRLVLKGGEPILGRPEVVDQLRSKLSCSAMDVCGEDRSICLPEEAPSLDNILDKGGDQQQPYYCGEPQNEPTCVPARPAEYSGRTDNDRDGDGISNETDNCPSRFNPRRPLSQSSQPNFDQDDRGDICDECPLNEGEQCERFDPDDRDSDGIDNEKDNCPGAANPGQEDRDDDGLGDVCDPCPEASNPGGTACPAKLEDVWTGKYTPGAEINVKDLIVTAVEQEEGQPAALFVQHPTDSGSPDAKKNSGIYIYMPDYSTYPDRGDNITVTAQVGTFHDALQLNDVQSLTINSTDNQLPEPVVVEPREIATDGPLASVYKGVLVRVKDVEVTDANPDAPDDFGEFAVTGDLRVDDAIHTIQPDPQGGAAFDQITGPLHTSFQNTKLIPRDESDVITGPVELSGFSPDTSYLKARTTGVPLPDLELELSRPPAEETTVGLSYSDETAVTGPSSLTFASGQPSRQVSLEAKANTAQPVNLTASLNGSQSSASIVTYSDASERQLAAFELSASVVSTTQTVQGRIRLDLPAPSEGLSVSLSASDPSAVDIPADITVPPESFSTTFDITAESNPGDADITAELNGNEQTESLTISQAQGGRCLIISEYIEGSGLNNKAIELYNCGTEPLQLSNIGLCLISNADTSCSQSTALGTRTLNRGSVHTICKNKFGEQGDPRDPIKNACDEGLSSIINFNGNDRLLVFSDDNGNGTFEPSADTIKDAFGQTNTEPSQTPWAEVNYQRCNFSPYDGTGSFDVTTFFKETGLSSLSNLGKPPKETCP